MAQREASAHVGLSEIRAAKATFAQDKKDLAEHNLAATMTTERQAALAMSLERAEETSKAAQTIVAEQKEIAEWRMMVAQASISSGGMDPSSSGQHTSSAPSTKRRRAA